MSVHLTLAGDWAECNGCELKFHFEDMTLAEANALPLEQMLALFEVLDPCTVTDPWGTRTWRIGDPDTSNTLHRDYGLPAVIGTEDRYLTFSYRRYAWYRQGLLHRDRDLPAEIFTDGRRCWWQEGRRHRDGLQPAVVHPNGEVEYWIHGEQFDLEELVGEESQ